MSEKQVEAFWDQVYAYAFVNHGFPVPDDPMPPLGDLSREADGNDQMDEGVAPGHGDETLYPGGISEFTRQQKIALEYFALQVQRYSKCIPVPESVRRTLRVPNRLSPETDDDGSDVSIDQEQEVAACNCPYCWMYTEDLTRFMEHLWEKHAVTIKGEERKDSGYDDTMAVEVESAGDNRASEVVPAGTLYAHSLAKSDAAEGSAEGTKAHTARSEEVIATAESARNLAVVRIQVHARPPKASDTDTKTSTSTRGIDVSFWRGLLTPPLRSTPSAQRVKTAAATLRQSRRAAMPQRSADTERHAQSARDDVEPIAWFDPYTRQNRDEEQQESLGRQISIKTSSAESERQESSHSPPTPSSGGLFKLPTVPASRMQKRDSPSQDERAGSSSTSFLRDYSNKQRHWICPHDEDCKEKFESLVLYIEHLSKHGLIVYKEWRDLHPPMLPAVLSLRCQRNASVCDEERKLR
jgi:hypothetical protein